MPSVYLGLFSKILDWIIDKIFSPVFTFVANLLGTVISWIFETILAPILTVIFQNVFPTLLEILFDALAEVFYGILVMILKLIDYIQVAFDVLIGMQPVTYYPASGPAVTDLSLLETLFQQPTLRMVFWQITFLGLGIAFLLAIYATARSAFDYEVENRRPVGQVMKTCFKTALTFILVPLFAYFLIVLSGIILNTVSDTLDGGEQSLGSTIFLISSLEAANDDSYNVAPDLNDELRYDYVTGEKDYTDLETVKSDFDLTEIDFIVAFSSSIFVLIILAICLITFVQRIFEVLVLYICSPLFVSVMPIDEGEKFGKWREMFVGKVFTGFGAAIGMRIYLMVMPMILSSSGVRIDFTAGGYASNSMNYVIRLIFVLGGAWAIFKSSSMLTSLISFSSGQGEQETGAFVGGAVFAHTAGAVGGMAFRGASRAAAHLGGKSEKQITARAESQQKFEKMQSKLAGSSGTKGVSARTAQIAKERKRLSIGEGTVAGSGAAKPAAEAGGQPVAGKKPGLSLGRIKLDRGTDGKLKFGAFQGKTVSFGRKADGSVGVKKFKLAGMKFKRGEDGKMHLSRAKLPGIKLKRGEGGKLRVSKVSLPGMRFKAQADGKLHLTHLGSKSGGVNFAHEVDAQGNSRMAGAQFGSHVWTSSKGTGTSGGTETATPTTPGETASSPTPPSPPRPPATSGETASSSTPPSPPTASSDGASSPTPPPPPTTSSETASSPTPPPPPKPPVTSGETASSPTPPPPPRPSATTSETASRPTPQPPPKPPATSGETASSPPPQPPPNPPATSSETASSSTPPPPPPPKPSSPGGNSDTTEQQAPPPPPPGHE